MNYFIIVKTGWAFDAREFSAQLRERWPLVQVDEIQDPGDSEVLDWCRSLIPAGEDVLFCDEAMNTSFPLRSDMTPAEIFHAVVSSYEYACLRLNCCVTSEESGPPVRRSVSWFVSRPPGRCAARERVAPPKHRVEELFPGTLSFVRYSST